MNANLTTKAAALALAFISTATVLASVAVGFEPRIADTTAVIALDRVTVTATKVN